MKNLFILPCIAFFILSSCEKEDSSDVNQEKIWTSYEMFYDQNQDKTVAVARFKFGGPTGTILELTDSTGANVTFNGDELTYNGFYSGHIKEYAGRLAPGTFYYTNTEGNTFVNEVPAVDSIAFPQSFDTIKKSTSQTLDWIGSDLAANQKVGVFVGSWTYGEDALFIATQEGVGEIVFGVNDMSGLANGNSTVYMDRETVVALDEGTSEGGEIKYKYRAQNASVEVIE